MIFVRYRSPRLTLKEATTRMMDAITALVAELRESRATGRTLRSAPATQNGPTAQDGPTAPDDQR